MILQSRRRLDLLTAEKRSLCLFLEEACYFSTNKSGSSKKFDKQGLEISWHLSNSWENWLNSWNWMPWVLPFLGPFLLLILILSFCLCLMSLFFKISSWPLTSLHQPNYPWATSNSFKYQKLWPLTNPLDPYSNLLSSYPTPTMPLSHRKQLQKIDLHPLS